MCSRLSLLKWNGALNQTQIKQITETIQNSIYLYCIRYFLSAVRWYNDAFIYFHIILLHSSKRRKSWQKKIVKVVVSNFLVCKEYDNQLDQIDSMVRLCMRLACEFARSISNLKSKIAKTTQQQCLYGTIMKNLTQHYRVSEYSHK